MLCKTKSTISSSSSAFVNKSQASLGVTGSGGGGLGVKKYLQGAGFMDMGLWELASGLVLQSHFCADYKSPLDETMISIK